MPPAKIDRRGLAAALGVALALQLWFALDASFNMRSLQWDAALNPSRALVHASLAFCLLLTVHHADQRADDGASPWRTYALAVCVGVGAGAVLQYLLHAALGVDDQPYQQAALPLRPVQMPRVGLEYLLWAAAIVAVHVNLRQQRRAEARMRKAHLDRESLRRRQVAVRLQALQTRVEPRLLLGTLERVRTLHGDHPARAERLLEDLVVFLRAALPAAHEGPSTWRRGVARIRAWLALQPGRQQAKSDQTAHALSADLPAELLDRPCPPLLLLTLIERLLDVPWAGPLTLSARVGGTGLQVTLQAPGAAAAAAMPPATTMDELRAWLNGLYMAPASLAFDITADGTRCILLTLPDETSPRTDR